MNKAELLNQLCKLIQDDGATPGERAAAEAAKARIMEKYGLTDAELSEIETLQQVFKFRNKHEESLLMQIAFYVVDEPEIYDCIRNGRKRPHAMAIEARQDELMKIEFLYEFYRALFERETEILFGAFIQKHELFPRKPIKKSKEWSDEQIKAMARMSLGLSDATPHLQITDGK